MKEAQLSSKEPLFCAQNYNFQSSSDIIRTQMLHHLSSLKYNSLKIYISYFKWRGPTE